MTAMTRGDFPGGSGAPMTAITRDHGDLGDSPAVLVLRSRRSRAITAISAMSAIPRP
jgi:hypothetical protein